MAGRDAKSVAKRIAETAALPVLTVSDAQSFAVAGGMIELFVENGRMRFAVNIDAVRRSQVRLSSKLLSLARIVRSTQARSR